MRTLKVAVVLATAIAMTGLLPTGPALAVGPNVLTSGAAPGGVAIPVGDTITSLLATGSTITFTTGAGGGGIGTKCVGSSITGQVVANPPAPGVATVMITNHSFNSCTSSIPGVTAVTTVVANNLPYKSGFSDAAGLPVTITPGAAGPIQITINELLGGVAVSCVWQLSAGVYNGNYGNGGSTLKLANQLIKLLPISPAGPCGGPTQFITAAYAPFVDPAAAAPSLVFVN
jgi:hypothetical protein